MWRHTRRGDKYVTVIIGLTRIPDGTGPARLLDMVEGHSKQAFKTWLAERPQTWRDQVDVVAMDGFTGFKTAASEELPDATAVMDPFHVVRLTGHALDNCRRRVQLAIHGHRGFKDDPLYKSRRTLHTGAGLLTDKQKDRLAALFADDAHVEVEATSARPAARQTTATLAGLGRASRRPSAALAGAARPDGAARILPRQRLLPCPTATCSVLVQRPATGPAHDQPAPAHTPARRFDLHVPRSRGPAAC